MKNKFFSLLIKQIVASVVCIGLIYTMKICGSSKLKHYADAIGRAIHYDIDTEAVKSWVSDTVSDFGDGVYFK